jgi:hypothetical protein
VYQTAAAALQAVRFDKTTGEKYSVLMTGLGASDITLCGWFNIRVDTNAFTCLLSMDRSGSAQYSFLSTTSTGTNIRLDSAAGGITMFNATVGTWYFMAYVHPTAHTTSKLAYWAAQGAGSLSSAGPSALNVDHLDTDTLVIGNLFDGGAPCNASAAQVRVWSAALNSTELLAEFHSSTPVRTSNLWAAYSFASGVQTTDDSGNGRTLTSAGTPATDTSGPTIT